MWKPYLKVIAKKACGAVHILDRFHIMAHMNKAIDKVRAEEAGEMNYPAASCEVSTGSNPNLRRSKLRGIRPEAIKGQRLGSGLEGQPWLFLKRVENLTFRQIEKLAAVLSYNLRTVRSYLIKEEFQFFWEYKSPYFAGKFLDQWCDRTMMSRIEPMKQVAKMLRRHRN